MLSIVEEHFGAVIGPSGCGAEARLLAGERPAQRLAGVERHQVGITSAEHGPALSPFARA